MNRTFLLVLGIIFSMWTASAQDICDMLYLMKEGYEAEYTTYDAKDRVTGIQRMKVLSVEKSGGSVLSKIETTIVDKKGKEVNTMESQFRCSDNTFYFDLLTMVNPQTMAAFTNSFEVEIKGVPAAYPSSLSVGDKIPDANIEIEARSGDIKVLGVYVKNTNQEVVAKENLTTPAGTFDCLKLTSDTEMKAIFRDYYRSESYFSKEYGTVKSLTYDKKGKLTSYMVLTMVKK
jgi:hypothetical protein